MSDVADSTKKDFVDQISQLPGVGKSKAEALWDAGYRSVDQVRAATAAELSEKVAGVGPKLAQAIVEGVRELGSAPARDEEIEVVESLEKRATTKKEETEIVEPEEHVARQKPKLDDATARALLLRNWMNRTRMNFVRRNWWQFKKLQRDPSWRRPHGELSKQRRGFHRAPTRVKVGFRGPAAARDLHPSGFEEVLVHNPGTLEGLNPEKQAVRIASGVGKRKRKLILEKAQTKGLRVLNPGSVVK